MPKNKPQKNESTDNNKLYTVKTIDNHKFVEIKHDDKTYQFITMNDKIDAKTIGLSNGKTDYNHKNRNKSVRDILRLTDVYIQFKTKNPNDNKSWNYNINNESEMNEFISVVSDKNFKLTTIEPKKQIEILTTK